MSISSSYFPMSLLKTVLLQIYLEGWTIIRENTELDFSYEDGEDMMDPFFIHLPLCLVVIAISAQNMCVDLQVDEVQLQFESLLDQEDQSSNESNQADLYEHLKGRIWGLSNREDPMTSQHIRGFGLSLANRANFTTI